MNKAKQFRNIRPFDMEVVVPSTSLPEKTEWGRDTPSDLVAAPYIDEAPTKELPTVEVDQLTTPRDLRAVYISPNWLSLWTGDVSIDNQATWLLPAISKLSSVSSHISPPAMQVQDGESHAGLIRGLVKNSGIYAISSLTGPLVSLVLTPYLTRVLTHTDYGALVVLNTAVALATGISELGLGAAFGRTYTYESKNRREQLDAISTLVLLLLLILVPFSLLGVLAAPWLSSLILGSPTYSTAVAVASALVLSQNLTVPGLSWLRVERRALFYSAISIGNLLMTAAANIVLVGILHMGVAGAQIANGLGDVVIIACTLPIIFWRAGFHLRFFMAISMLAFGVPNVMNLVSGWALQLSDRYLLEHFSSLSVVGGYSVAYTIGGILSTAIITPFTLAWYVLRFPIAKRKDALQVFKLIFRGFSFVLLFATLAISLFGSSLLDFLFPASYHTQSFIIPIIALSTVFLGIFNVVSLGAALQRKTWLIALGFIVSSLINFGLNIVLIPQFGTMGAAQATLIGYMALALITYLFNQRIYPVPFEISLFLVALAIGIALYIVGNGLTEGQSAVTACGMYIGVLLFYGLLLLFLGKFLPTVKLKKTSLIQNIPPETQ